MQSPSSDSSLAEDSLPAVSEDDSDMEEGDEGFGDEQYAE
eukprot:CAMPEP_0197534708 /NCGR_PEP_ID=MMETSP1318-20131121/48065_1 /TAXON_ID=552666 /ORGANISM="Partenskyella glossopodia, Strain RCC365" /LENGTH=39 /DNA_ID= /DNA_START= /DNA_END= /DNA_ORIENTATION=